MIANIKAEVIKPVLVKGLPGDISIKTLDVPAEAISGRHNQGDGKT
jgi:hypothetical protein